MIQTIKVVAPKEIAKVEKIACAEGCEETAFMETAGQGIAGRILSFIETRGLEKTVVLLAGKGNNGGDAYVAGCHLLQKGFSVEAIAIYPEEKWGTLCLRQAKRFIEEGGKVKKDLTFPKGATLVDGLVGTGFSGKAERELAEAIKKANESGLPIIAIDIPSGLCGTTGNVETVAIRATTTVYLQFPKIGFFLRQGFDYVGTLLEESFGLPSRYQEMAHAEALLIKSVDLASFFPPVEKTRNKYSRGYVVALAGSESMPGAGGLASLAALRSGAGIVRCFHLASNTPFSLPLEIILSSMEDQKDAFEKELKRSGSFLVGPGLGRDKKADKAIRRALEEVRSSVVIDADALFFLAENPSFSIPLKSILTPHKGELKRLLESQKLEKEFLFACQEFVEKKQTTLLVKGAPNFLFTPDQIPYILPFGNPGMATAGSGDVLSGILAALLAQKMTPVNASIAGCYLHGLAGDFARKEKTVHSIIASDIIEHLPQAFGSF